MVYKQFYSEMGKMLYALANVDKEASLKEVRTLKELVRKELVPKEASIDAYGTDAAFYTEFEFDVLAETGMLEPEAAFESFMNYIEDHHTALNHSLIETTRRVASKLAEVYHHPGKKEAKMLKRLNQKLDALLLQNKKVISV